MTRREEEDEGNFMSFLDVIACAFGAIVLLVLIIPIGKPDAPIEEGVFDEYRALTSTNGTLTARLSAAVDRLEASREQLAMIENAVEQASTSAGIDESRIRSVEAQVARQLAENRVLEQQVAALAPVEPSQNLVPDPAPVASVENEKFGIPADAEYVVFVIDTSGSMRTIASSVSRSLAGILDIYPQLKGFQVLDDQGAPLFSGTAGTWLNDSVQMRGRVTAAIRGWNPYSNSSPIEGVEVALTHYLQGNARTAIVIFGDDHSQEDFEGFLRRVEQAAPPRLAQTGRLRIHALGFSNERRSTNPERFGLLMRELTYRYSGAYLFVATEPPSPIGIYKGARTGVEPD
jgi:hypothetical protein